MTELTLPSYQDIEDAAQRILGFAHKTPVLTSTTANKQFGAELFFKCENFQRMGAFKFRGAFNALAQLSPEQKKQVLLLFHQVIMLKVLLWPHSYSISQQQF